MIFYVIKFETSCFDECKLFWTTSMSSRICENVPLIFKAFSVRKQPLPFHYRMFEYHLHEDISIPPVTPGRFSMTTTVHDCSSESDKALALRWFTLTSPLSIIWICKCGQQWEKNNNGYSNLVSHIHTHHIQKKETTVSAYTSAAGKNICVGENYYNVPTSIFILRKTNIFVLSLRCTPSTTRHY